MAESLRPRVVLADDHPGVLKLLQRILEPSFDVVGHVNTGSALLAETPKFRPDVVVLDVSLPDIDGLDVCRELKRATPQTKVVVLTAANDADIRQKAFSVGASAFVLKYLMADELISAIHSALRENTYSSVA